MSRTPDLPGELARLQRDPNATARAVGAALTAACLDALDDDERRWIGAIEGLRADIDASEEEIDTALSNKRGVTKPGVLGDISRRRSKKAPWGVLLLTLSRTLAPQRAVELGSCVGVSGAYLGAGLHLAGGGRLETIEGAPALAERAAAHISSLGLDNIDVETGLFVDVFEPLLDRGGPIQLVFIDGHHQEDPTLAYFETLTAKLDDHAVVVFDDIRWSEGMERAWAKLITDARMEVVVDLDSVGICVVRPAGAGAPPRSYTFPTVSTMRSKLASPGRSTAPDGNIPPPEDGPARLNWGCGAKGEPGWINADLSSHPTIEISGDIRDGLPLDDDSMDYVTSIHALTMIPLPDLQGVLGELRRVLKPGGTLRLALADLDKGIDAYRRGDRDYFVVPDRDAATISGKFIIQIMWYGYVVTPLTAEFTEEQLRGAGFSEVHHCTFRETASGHPGIVDLDDRENESFFIEAVR